MFQKIEHARSSPTFCAFCQTNEGPFIETGVDLLGHGLVLICTRGGNGQSGCAEQIGRIGGHMVDREEHDAKVAEFEGDIRAQALIEEELVGKLAATLSPEAILELIDAGMRDTAAKLLAKKS